MKLASITLKNWLAFRDEQRLILDAKVYAITARLTTDVERSNFCGKTALMEAVAFALYGRHRFRTEDEFITRGEQAAEVSLTFDDGSVVTRTRTRGKSTRVWWRTAGRPAVEAYGNEAQSAILEAVGLSEDDFHATCSFEQRQMAKLVLARPKERMEMVAGWLALDPLERAEADLRSQATKLWSAIATMQVERDAARTQAKDSLAEYNGVEVADVLAVLSASLVTAKVKKATTEAARRDAVSIARTLDDAATYRQIVEEGKEANAAYQEAHDVLAKLGDRAALVEHHIACEQRAHQARLEREKRSLVAQGLFDGRCPVASITCPATERINADRKSAMDALTIATTYEANVRDELRKVGANVQRCDDAKSDCDRAHRKLEQLRADARRLKPHHDAATGLEAPDLTALKLADDDAGEALAEAQRKLARLEERIETRERAVKRASGITLAIVEQEERLSLLQAAIKVFGRNGAQRIVAESALNQIETSANAMLADAGITLSVAVQWSREGDGLAATCDQCGWPFPASAKVKECSRCKEPRGAKTVQALDFILSDRSGAAEDLVGCAIQLAASEWLRGVRHAEWSTALIDEPTAQMDASHRRAWMLAATRMLKAVGIDQAFIVSHHSEIASALPGRIEIEHDGKHATAKVVS